MTFFSVTKTFSVLIHPAEKLCPFPPAEDLLPAELFKSHSTGIGTWISNLRNMPFLTFLTFMACGVWYGISAFETCSFGFHLGHFWSNIINFRVLQYRFCIETPAKGGQYIKKAPWVMDIQVISVCVLSCRCIKILCWGCHPKCNK